MKISRNTGSSQSTIAISASQISSHQYIIISNKQDKQLLWKKESNDKNSSIVNQKFYQNVITKPYLTNYNANKNTNKRICPIHPKQLLCQVLTKIVLKKQRYCVQILKQFILFPEDTDSSVLTISTYDPLIFQDEIIHSLVKILQTKSIQNKIWGFINLKMMPFLKAAVKIQQKITQVYQQQIKQKKKVSFDLIKKYSDEAVSIIFPQQKYIQIKNDFQESSKTISIQEKQTKSKNCLSSRLIQQIITPTTHLKVDTPTQQPTPHTSTHTSYTLSIPPNPNPCQSLSSSHHPSTHSHISTINKNSPFFQSQKSIKQFQKDTNNKMNKYNIIHYYEKSKEMQGFLSQSNKRNKKCFDNINSKCSTHHQCHVNRACCSCDRKCCCCERKCFHQEYNIKRSNCSWQDNSKTPQILINGISKSKKTFQKQVYLNQTDVSNKVTHQYKSQIYKKSNGLSQLESRIQYMNFLRKLVQQQENQQK